MPFPKESAKKGKQLVRDIAVQILKGITMQKYEEVSSKVGRQREIDI